MNNKPLTFANKLADEKTNNNNDEEDETMNVAPLDGEGLNEGENPTDNDVSEVDNKEQETIKSVELTGKNAINLNQNNPTKKIASTGTFNNNNLTKKKTNNHNNNLTPNLTQRRNNSVNLATEEGASANTGDKNVMRSLNKVAMNLLNHHIVMKLFHFQTELYGAHKASDGYLEKFATTMDKFLEIAQGIYGRLTIKKFKLEGSSHTDDNIMKHIEGIIMLLRTGIDEVLANYTDLINVRDELVGDAEQLKYLLSFK